VKKIFLLLMLAGSLSALAGQELKVGVKGMVCAFCAQGIEKKFKAQKEVESVDVSLENKLVKLKFKDGQRLPDEKISEILKDAGYEADFGAKK
jgi:periplasmic mercuric ion binding protein